MQKFPAKHGDGQHGEVVAEDRPHRDDEHQPPHDGQVRVPRLGEQLRPVEAHEERDERPPCRAGRPVPPPSPGHPEHRADREHVERRGGRLHGPGGARRRSCRRARAPRSSGARDGSPGTTRFPIRPGSPISGGWLLATSRIRSSVWARSSTGNHRGWASSTTATTKGTTIRTQRPDAAPPGGTVRLGARRPDASSRRARCDHRRAARARGGHLYTPDRHPGTR